ncbi:TonB-dependent receptor [bacterium]|nr:TonB-dependent receptor [bacterium]
MYTAVRYGLIGLLAVSFSSPIFSESPTSKSTRTSTVDVVIVTANAIDVPAWKLGVKTGSIDIEEAKRLGNTDLTGVMNQMSNANVVETAHQSSAFVRGLPSRFAKVYFNGMDLKDPIHVNGNSFWDAVNLASVTRIDVIDGASSALYGGYAVGSVINLVGSDSGSYAEFSGSNEYYTASVHGATQKGAWTLEGATSRVYDNRVSSKTGNSEKDLYNATNHYGRVKWTGASETSELQWLHTEAIIGLDPESFEASAETENQLTSIVDRIGWRNEWKFSNQLKSEIKATFGSVSRLELLPVRYNRYTGQRYDIDAHTKWQEKAFGLAVGVEYEYDSGYQNTSFERIGPNWMATTGLYSAASYTLDRADLTVSGRLVSNDDGRWTPVYGIGGAVRLLQGLELRGNYSKGYRKASIYELANTTAPAALTPETAKCSEIGVWVTGNVGSAYVTFFNSVVASYIDYDFSTGYIKTGKDANSRGYEVGALIDPVLFLGPSRLSYTGTVATLGADRAPRIPEYKFTASTVVNAGDYSIGALFQSVGSRRDTIYSATVVPAYTTLDLSVRYLGFENWTPFLTVTNVLNSQYEIATTYKAPDRSIILGVSWHD